jgi:hypothetical protein
VFGIDQRHANQRIRATKLPRGADNPIQPRLHQAAILISIGVCGNDIGSLKHNSGAQRDHVGAPLLAIRQEAGRGLSDL